MSLVTLVMMDGLRPEAVRRDVCPRLCAVMARGSATLAAASVMPCVTLPCHMSIFHSVPPARHGVTTNEWSPMARPVPGLADVARAAGRRTAFIYNWEPLRNLSRPGSLSFAHFRDSAYAADGDTGVAAAAARAILEEQPDFAFVYFGTVDTAGHEHGWLSDAYLAQVGVADRALGVVLDALPQDATVLIQSDHGGHEGTHGVACAEDLTIPWVLAGPGIRRAHTLRQGVSLMDTAPTLARALGLSVPAEWEGAAVAEAFL